MYIANSILASSFAVFYQQGFHDSGVELLAKRAGTTKRTLYAHFGNKEGLINAVLEYRHKDFMHQLTLWFDPLTTLTTLNKQAISQCYLHFLQDWIRSDNFYGCLFINACAEFSSSDAMPHAIAKQHKDAIRQFLLDKFTLAGVSQPQSIADTLFVFGEGMIVSAQTGQTDLQCDAGLIGGWLSTD